MKLVQGRTCGGCTACCKQVAVAELRKPFDCVCEHQDIGVGCRVYDGRPRSCAAFECAWLAGLLEEEDRPDKSGVVVYFEQWDSGGTPLYFVETRPGAVLELSKRLPTDIDADTVLVPHGCPRATQFAPAEEYQEKLALLGKRSFHTPDLDHMMGLGRVWVHLGVLSADGRLHTPTAVVEPDMVAAYDDAARKAVVG